MTNDPLIGKKLANFQIERLLAHGGMADVYYGMDVSLQRPVAIKVIDARFRKNPSYAQRFISEARAMAAWRHENLVQVYYADQQDDLYYFVMEYVDGVSLDVLLRQYADKGEFMPYDEVLHIGKGVASALDYAHRHGVIHRDIKPPNVMISKDNRVVLMDFGLALDTQQGSIGEVFGTPHYIAPEQARRSADATALSDVYSLGVMMYEILTGVVPFDDPSATSVAILHLSEAPPPPRSLNPALSERTEMVLLRVLEKDPKHRYPSTLEFIKELERALKAPPKPITTAKLPPLPPGISAPPDRKLWNGSLAERVTGLMEQADSVSPMPTSPTKPRPSLFNAPLPPVSTRKRRRGWVLPVGIVLVLGIIGFFAIWVIGSIGTANLRAEAEATGTVVALIDERNRQATLAAVPMAQTAAVASDTPTATVTSSPTHTLLPPTLTHTPSPSATDTQTIAPTSTLPPTETATESVTVVVIATEVEPSATHTSTWTHTPTVIPPTFTSRPSETLVPTHTPTVSLTPRPTRTRVVLATNTPRPTDTRTPTLTPTPTTTFTASPTSLTPTVRYPDGNLIQMTWNSRSFYVFNPNDFSIVVEPLAFQALLPDGTPLSYRLEGDRWMIGFPVIESRKCVAVEFLLETEVLKPQWCSGYNAILTLVSDDEENFWLRRGGATMFRVLWADEEIGRCRISSNSCEVRLP